MLADEMEKVLAREQCPFILRSFADELARHTNDDIGVLGPWDAHVAFLRASAAEIDRLKAALVRAEGERDAIAAMNVRPQGKSLWIAFVPICDEGYPGGQWILVPEDRSAYFFRSRQEAMDAVRLAAVRRASGLGEGE